MCYVVGNPTSGKVAEDTAKSGLLRASEGQEFFLKKTPHRARGDISNDIAHEPIIGISMVGQVGSGLLNCRYSICWSIIFVYRYSL